MTQSQELLNAAKQAGEIAEKTQQLTDSLKDITVAALQQQSSGEYFISALTIFVLACFVGYYVVWKVTPSLHTPLMSVTNAISGIVIIGAIVAAMPVHFDFSSFLGYVAVFLSAINIFGGFLVTERMLQMFKKK